MKAAILKEFGQPLSVENISDPVIGTGEVMVEIVSAPVLHYAKEVYSGKRKYLLTLPMVPGTGAVGKVLSVGPDSTNLKIGDWVFCDPTIRSRDGAITPDITLQGLSARGEGGQILQKYFHNGSFAEKMLLPTENAVKIGVIDHQDAPKWCSFGLLLVPYGGLLALNLKAGETILISGATGNFGSAAVTIAMAMGAGCVIAPGRNKAVLDDLENRFGKRLRTVVLTGDDKTDMENMRKAAPNDIDCVLDILPPSVSASTVRNAIMTVRESGRIVLMGGVGMLGGDGLDLPYPWIMRNNITIKGQWMYPREAVYRLAALVKSGLLSLDLFQISEFKLDDANDALEYAEANSGAFKITVINP
jgi:alcohol dehydrogenase